MDGQNDFFTLQSLGTFAGATGATMVIANGIQKAFNFNPRWLALGVAQFVCLATVFLTHLSAAAGTPTAASDYLVAVVNGFLVFCSAAGVTATSGAAAGAVDRGVGHRRGFLTPWF